jgi:hypothetical protein
VRQETDDDMMRGSGVRGYSVVDFICTSEIFIGLCNRRCDIHLDANSWGSGMIVRKNNVRVFQSAIKRVLDSGGQMSQAKATCLDPKLPGQSPNESFWTFDHLFGIADLRI